MHKTKSAGGVILNKYGQVLIVNQRGNSWSLPKGHIKFSEDSLDAAKREIYEEAGISEVEYIDELGTYSRFKLSKDGTGDDFSELKTIIFYLFKTDQLDLDPVDPHNPEARWVDIDSVADFLTHPKDKAFFISCLNKIRSHV